MVVNTEHPLYDMVQDRIMVVKTEHPLYDMVQDHGG